MGKGITYRTSGRVCPCCGCQERAVGCHGKCDQYKTWDGKRQAERQERIRRTSILHTVYEILEETVPNHYFYISEHKVQDVSVKAVKYADEWEPYDYENLYFTREEAEAAMKKRRKDNGF